MTILLNNINSFLQNDVLTLLLTIIWFFSFSLILSDLLNKKQGEMYLLSFVISSFLLFIGGIVNNVRLACYLGWILIVVYFLYILIKKKIQLIIKRIDIFGSISFLVISLVLFVLYQNKGFVATDEFMHWGPMTREMFKLNKFYCVPESSLLVHKDYPPFFSLIELLLCLFKGEYNECYLYVGLLSFYFCIAIAFISKINDKFNKIITLLLFLLLGFIIQKMPGENISLYLTIYIDYVLAVFSSYIIYKEFTSDPNTKQDKLIRILYASALLLSKQIGIVFYILYLVIVFFKKKLDVYSILLPLIGFIIWKVIIKFYGITGQFSISNVMLREDVINIFARYIKALLFTPIFIKPIKFSFIISNILIISILVFISYKKKTNYYLIYIIGLIIYVLVLMLLYGFVFSIEEAESLASFERYEFTYTLFGIAYILFIIMNNFNNKILYLATALIFIILADLNNSNIYSVKEKKDVLVIKQWGEPISFQEQYDNGYIINTKIHNYIDDTVNYEDLAKEISNYNYVYVELYDDNFYNYWVDYTSSYDLENDSVYYVENINNKVTYSNDNFTKIYYVIKYNLQESR